MSQGLALRLQQARERGWLHGGALVVAVAATFVEAIFTSAVFFQRDILNYWYPHRAVVRRALAEGSLPLWNAFVGFGAPLLADSHVQLVYPPTWFALLLPAAVHYKLFAIGHTLLAAAGAWALARRCGLERTPAAAAGLVFALSGPLLSAVNLYHHHTGAAWLPWLLWALEGLLREPGARSARTLAVVTAAQLLAGSGDMCLAGALLGAGRLLVHFAHPGMPGRLPVFRHGAAAGALGLALAALQVLPTAAMAADSFRTRLSTRTNTYWSLHPASLLDLAVPRLLAELPFSAGARADLFEGREPLLYCVYLGLVPLALAALALAVRPRAAFVPATGLALLLAASLGRHGPLYGALLAVPGFSLMRYPQKLLLPAALCLALLAAFGVAAWGRGWSLAERRRARGLAVALLALAAAAVVAARWVAGEPTSLASALTPSEPPLASVARGLMLRLLRFALLSATVALLLWRRAAREHPAAPPYVLLLLGTADLVAVGHGVNPLLPAELADRRPALLQQLVPGERLYTDEEENCRKGAPRTDWNPRWTPAHAFQETLRPPSGARWGLRGSFDGEFTGLGSPWVGLFTSAKSRLGDSPAGMRLLEISGVSHVLHVGSSVRPGLSARQWPSPYACPLLILPVERPLPPAYVASREKLAIGPEATLIELLDPAFEPRSEVVVERLGGDPALAEARQARARIASRRANAVVVEAELDGSGVLVLLDGFAPGWLADVDGRPAEVLRANGLFRGVRLGPGRHRVTFRYRPWALKAGAAVSALGLICAAGLALRLRRLARREGDTAT